MHRFVPEMCTSLCDKNVYISVAKLCIVEYEIGALWDLWDWSNNLSMAEVDVHKNICMPIHQQFALLNTNYAWFKRKLL